MFGRLGHVDQELTPDQDRALAALLAVALVGLPQLDRTFRDRGLVHVEFGLLDALAGQPAGWRLSDLAHALNMSPSRLTHRMRKLVDRGYVRQYPSPNDGRGTIAEITPEGRALRPGTPDPLRPPHRRPDQGPRQRADRRSRGPGRRLRPLRQPLSGAAYVGPDCQGSEYGCDDGGTDQGVGHRGGYGAAEEEAAEGVGEG